MDRESGVINLKIIISVPRAEGVRFPSQSEFLGKVYIDSLPVSYEIYQNLPE